MKWKWIVINGGLSNIWDGNEFLGCCATQEAKKICDAHNRTTNDSEINWLDRIKSFLEIHKRKCLKIEAVVFIVLITVVCYLYIRGK